MSNTLLPRAGLGLAAFGAVLPLLLAVAPSRGVLPWEAEGRAPSARLFARGVISTGDDDAHVTFEPDGRHVYFLKATPDFRYWTIAVVAWTGSGWGTPRVAPFSDEVTRSVSASPPDPDPSVPWRRATPGAVGSPGGDLGRRRAPDGRVDEGDGSRSGEIRDGCVLGVAPG